jgi:choline dehydrogenase
MRDRLEVPAETGLAAKAGGLSVQVPNADFIVIGAGVAGCLLASEISRRQLGSVLVLEAGDWPVSRNLKLPVAYPHAFESKNAWQFSTVPQAKLANRRISLPAGKTLGGSSAINAMIYLRGHRTDYESWNSSLGQDWDVESVSNTFGQLERLIEERCFSVPEPHPILRSFLEQSLGLFEIHSRFYEPLEGLGRFVRCQQYGRRVSAWSLWLKGSRSRAKPEREAIRVLEGTSVHRIVFDLERAVGVEISNRFDPSQVSLIRANRGVLLCAGSIQSPRLLLESGIGDREDLQKLGIETKIDSGQVGENLQDHLVLPIVRHLRSMQSLPSTMTADDRRLYVRSRTGPIASNIAEVGGFFRLQSAEAGAADSLSGSCAPDFQWHVTPTHYLEYPMREPPTNAMSVGVTVLRPTSRGQVRLTRSNQADSTSKFAIEIDPRYHTSDDDLSRLVAAVRWTRATLDRGEYSELLANEILPGERRQTEEQLRIAVSRLATTIYHYVGTCAMGKESGSVLDSRFRVRGAERLWVCDASAMPTNVSGNTQATVMMMAYRLAGWLESTF